MITDKVHITSKTIALLHWQEMQGHAIVDQLFSDSIDAWRVCSFSESFLKCLTNLLQQASSSSNNGALATEEENSSLDSSSTRNGFNGTGPADLEQAGVNGNGGYQGVDAHNDLGGNGWQESLAADTDSVRSSKDLARENERIAERHEEEETSQAVK